MSPDAIARYSAEIDETLGIYLDMRRGFGSLLKEFNQIRADFVAKTPGASMAELDAKPFTYEITDTEAGSYILHECTQAQYRDRIAPSGESATRAGNMCLVHIYELWEVRYREEIARALGKNRDALTSDLFGDIRHLRNSILHHNSISLPEVARCKVIKWFKPGAKIWFTRAQFLEVGRLLKAELGKMGDASKVPACHA